MSVTLDGNVLFDQQDLEIQQGSFSRSSLEKSIAGLDGVLSIDLGRRSRVITQKGVIMAQSKAAMDKQIAAISAFLDGDTHTLSTKAGLLFNNLRMDVLNSAMSAPAASASLSITKLFTHNWFNSIFSPPIYWGVLKGRHNVTYQFRHRISESVWNSLRYLRQTAVP